MKRPANAKGRGRCAYCWKPAIWFCDYEVEVITQAGWAPLQKCRMPLCDDHRKRASSTGEADLCLYHEKVAKRDWPTKKVQHSGEMGL